MNPWISFLVIVLVSISIIAASLLVFHTNPSQPACDSFGLDACPSRCVVCPPCEVLQLHSLPLGEFCAGLGFDRGWYEQVSTRLDERRPWRLVCGLLPPSIRFPSPIDRPTISASSPGYFATIPWEGGIKIPCGDCSLGSWLHDVPWRCSRWRLVPAWNRSEWGTFPESMSCLATEYPMMWQHSK